MPSKTKKLGLALGGGGSRAFVHLGALSVLAEAGIQVDVVTGASMGGILGAMYAVNPDAAALRATALDYFKSSSLFGSDRKPARNDGLFLRPGLFGWFKKYLQTAFLANLLSLRRSVLRTNRAHKAVDDLLPCIDISETTLPFATTAVDLTAAEVVTFSSGPLQPALKAGTAVGVVFKPYRWQDHNWIDAAPVCSVPVSACRALGAETVLAIDIRTPLPACEHIQNGFDVISRIESIESRIINDLESKQADILIKPDVGNVFWADFTSLDRIVTIGEEAMRLRLDEVQNLIQL